jgi:hypothetical protein
MKTSSEPGESERDFRTRTDQLLREERDREVAALRSKYTPKIAVIEERIRRAQASAQKQQEQASQASQAKINTVLEIGGSLLGAFLGGGRRMSATKIATAGRAATRAYTESQDVGRAEGTVEAMNQQLADVRSQMEAEVTTLQATYDPAQEKLETITIRPKKTGIVVKSMLVRTG